MKISFKDVGQGDSILLEWLEEGKPKIGVIDCSLKDSVNPVLDYIKEAAYKEIEFLILSHPHSDHFSGMLELLDYLYENGINIRIFAHTMTHADKKFWRYFEDNSVDRRKLNKIIKKLKLLNDNNTINEMRILSNGNSININNNTVLQCLSPSHDDIEEYQRMVDLDAYTNSKKASRAANYLATVFELKIDNKHILFTSDAERFSLQGIINRNKGGFSNKKFEVCQIPHHGSEKNHLNEFWSLVETSGNKYAIISAGEHRKYKHPSYEVVQAFADQGYTVHCTNTVNGIKKHKEYLESISLTSMILDNTSVIALDYAESNDRVFVLTGDTFILQ